MPWYVSVVVPYFWSKKQEKYKVANKKCSLASFSLHIQLRHWSVVLYFRTFFGVHWESCARKWRHSVSEKYYHDLWQYIYILYVYINCVNKFLLKAKLQFFSGHNAVKLQIFILFPPRFDSLLPYPCLYNKFPILACLYSDGLFSWHESL